MKKLRIAAAVAAMGASVFAECAEIKCAAAWRMKLAGKTVIAKSLAKATECDEDSCWLKAGSYRLAGYIYSIAGEECACDPCNEFFGAGLGFHFWNENKVEVKMTPSLAQYEILRNSGAQDKAYIGMKLTDEGGKELYLAGFGKYVRAKGILKSSSGFFAGELTAPKCSITKECVETATPASAFAPCTLAKDQPEAVIAFGRWSLTWKQDKVDTMKKTGNNDCLFPAYFKAATL